jgi:hypothetical protein
MDPVGATGQSPLPPPPPTYGLLGFRAVSKAAIFPTSPASGLLPACGERRSSAAANFFLAWTPSRMRREAAGCSWPTELHRESSHHEGRGGEGPARDDSGAHRGERCNVPFTACAFPLRESTGEGRAPAG